MKALILANSEKEHFVRGGAMCSYVFPTHTRRVDNYRENI